MYYASAEVLMLRTLGIPARMAVGFAEGEFDAQRNRYTVARFNSHAWPEVYFPGIGWVEFEPTSGQPVLNRLPGDTNQAGQPIFPDPGNTEQGNADQPADPAEESRGGSGSGAPPNSLLRLMLFFGLLVAFIGGVSLAYTTGLLDKIFQSTCHTFGKPLPVLLNDTYASFAITPPYWLRRWAYFASLKPIERSFGVVYQSLRWLGAKPLPSQTPAEAATVLTARLPEVAEETHSLLQEYQQALFGQKHFELSIARHAVDLIRRQALRTAFHQRLAAFRTSVLRIFSRKPNKK